MNEELSIVLKARDEASKVIEDVAKKSQTSFGQIAKQVSASMAVAGGAVTGFLAMTVKSASEAQVEMAKVDTIVKKFGGTGKDAESKIKSLNDAIAKAGEQAQKMGFDDEEASVALAKLAQSTGDVKKSQDMMATAMDLARFKGISLTEATQAMTLMMGGNTKIAKQMGIEIKEGAKASEIFGEVQKRVSGQATAYSQTFQGQMESLNVSLGNVRETIGTALLPIIQQFATQIQGTIVKVQEWINTHPQLFEQIVKFSAIGGVLLTVLGAIGFILPAIATAVTALASPVGIIIVGIGLLVAWLFKLYSQGQLTMQGLQNLAKSFDEKTGVITAFKRLLETLEPYMPALKQLADFVAGVLLEGLKVLGQVIGTVVIVAFKGLAGAIDMVTKGIQIAQQAFNLFREGIVGIMDFVEQARQRFESMANAIRSARSAIGSGISNVASSVGNFVGLASGGIVDRPTMALIGEGGEKEAVIPLSKLKDLLGSAQQQGSGKTINAPININARVEGGMDVRQIGRELAWELQRI